MRGGPVAGVDHQLQKAADDVGKLAQGRAADRQRARRAVVVADRRVGMKADIGHHQRIEHEGDFQPRRAAHIDRVDLARQQRMGFGQVQAAQVAFHFDQGDILVRQAFQAQGIEHAAQGGGAEHVDLDVVAARHGDAPSAQVTDGADAGLRQRQDLLRFVGPGQADHARVGAARARPQGRCAATLAEGIGQHVFELLRRVAARLARAQRADRHAIGRRFAIEPAEMHGDAERRGHGRAFVPEGRVGCGHGRGT